MHTVEKLEQTLAIAVKLGYGVRHEWLGGSGGGRCEFAGQKWIFVDLALNTFEQLDQVVEALKQDPAIYQMDLNPEMKSILVTRKAA